MNVFTAFLNVFYNLVFHILAYLSSFYLIMKIYTLIIPFNLMLNNNFCLLSSLLVISIASILVKKIFIRFSLKLLR